MAADTINYLQFGRENTTQLPGKKGEALEKTVCLNLIKYRNVFLLRSGLSLRETWFAVASFLSFAPFFLGGGENFLM